jgi:hypothetical protein
MNQSLLRIKNPRREILLKCPFDGGKAILQIKAQSHMPYHVECVLCHASTTFYRISGHAVYHWNRRVLHT